MKFFAIGKMSKQTGCKIPTIRFYEEERLLPPAFRTEGNQRRYSEVHLTRLRFILHARELGFTLDAIRELIRLSGADMHDHEADEIAERQLEEVERKIARLKSLKKELSTMLRACKEKDSVQCRVIEVLSDHSLCNGEHS